MATASRQVWSFARDDGMVFSRWFRKLHNIQGTPVPVNATFRSLSIVTVFALLNLGGTEIFDSAYSHRTRRLDSLSIASTISLTSEKKHVLQIFEHLLTQFLTCPRYRRPWSGRLFINLHDQHWMCAVAAFLRRAASEEKVVTW